MDKVFKVFTNLGIYLECSKRTRTCSDGL